MKKIILTALLTTWVYATSAYDGDITFKQADGSIFQGHVQGDEWFNWIESTDGDTIQYNINSKNYEYAEIKILNGQTKLVPSGDKVGSLPAGTKHIDSNTLGEIWTKERTQALSHRFEKKHCH